MNGTEQTEAATDAEMMTAAEADETIAASDADVATVSQAEFDQVKGERDQLIDRMARLQAEFDNARKREAKERADFRDYAVGNAAESFLGVLDNFQLALKSQGSPEQFRAGIELIAKQFDDAVRNLGVVPVETTGQQFDPRSMEALGSVETTEFPDDAVVDEVRRGYRIKERLLRPALVRVAVNNSTHQA
ncbi:nucleotide exchange factor GrpE [Terriglobus roseus]|nr:nucleotide exchange factor GrpE [Terriglobus roseus]